MTQEERMMISRVHRENRRLKFFVYILGALQTLSLWIVIPYLPVAMPRLIALQWLLITAGCIFGCFILSGILSTKNQKSSKTKKQT